MLKIQKLGFYEFQTQDLESIGVNILISPVANGTLGMSLRPHANSEEIQRNKCDFVSLGQ